MLSADVCAFLINLGGFLDTAFPEARMLMTFLFKVPIEQANYILHPGGDPRCRRTVASGWV